MNKRGVFETVVASSIIFIVAVMTIIFTGLVVSNFNDKFQGVNESVHLKLNESKVLSEDFDSSFSAFDTGLAFLLVGLVVASIIAIRMFPSYRWWIVVAGIVGLVFFGLVGLIIEDFWFGFNSNVTIDAFTTSYPFMSFFMSHFTLFVVVYLGLLIVVAATSEGEAA